MFVTLVSTKIYTIQTNHPTAIASAHLLSKFFHERNYAEDGIEEKKLLCFGCCYE